MPQNKSYMVQLTMEFEVSGPIQSSDAIKAVEGRVIPLVTKPAYIAHIVPNHDVICSEVHVVEAKARRCG